jgi:hypothetical protein
MIETLLIGRTECSTSSKIAGNRRNSDVKISRDPDRGADMRTKLTDCRPNKTKAPGTPVENTYYAVRWKMEPLGLYIDRSMSGNRAQARKDQKET